MNSLSYTITLISDALPASGITTSAIIDKDIASDEMGLPFLPAKRIKGLLLESLLEVKEMKGADFNVNSLFGDIGKAESNSIIITDGLIKNYTDYYQWLSWAGEKFSGEFQSDSIIDTFTSIRRQTKLKEGIAVEHSLRSSRVLNKGLTFSGTIAKNGGFNGKEKSQLALAFSNLRFFGVNRNRGFGKIKCELLDENKNTIDLNKSYNEV